MNIFKKIFGIKENSTAFKVLDKVKFRASAGYVFSNRVRATGTIVGVRKGYVKVLIPNDKMFDPCYEYTFSNEDIELKK